MTAEQLKQQRERIVAGLNEARLQVARFEGALEFVNFLIETTNAPKPPEQPVEPIKE